MQDRFDPKKRFNERAKVYDADILKIIPGYKALHDDAVNLLETSLPEDAYVLIAGVGTGNESIALAARNPGWRITGFDIAENMIETTQAKIKKYGLEGRIELIHGGIDDVLQESFDAATSLLVMHFISYQEKLNFLNGISFRLKPGAKLILADITGHRKSREFEDLLTAWEAYQMETREPDDIAETIGHTLNDLDILNHEEVISLLGNTGFTNTFLFWKSLVFSAYIAEKE